MKKWYTSKTVWFNVLGLVLLVGQYVVNVHLLSPEHEAAVLTVVNVLLRLKTDTALKM